MCFGEQSKIAIEVSRVAGYCFNLASPWHMDHDDKLGRGIGGAGLVGKMQMASKSAGDGVGWGTSEPVMGASQAASGRCTRFFFCDWVARCAVVAEAGGMQ